MAQELEKSWLRSKLRVSAIRTRLLYLVMILKVPFPLFWAMRVQVWWLMWALGSKT